MDKSLSVCTALDCVQLCRHPADFSAPSRNAGKGSGVVLRAPTGSACYRLYAVLRRSKFFIVSRETILPQATNKACFCIGSSISGVDNTGRPPVFLSTNRSQWHLALTRARTAKMGLKKKPVRLKFGHDFIIAYRHGFGLHLPRIVIVSRETFLPQSTNEARFCILRSNSGVQNTSGPPVFRSTNRPQLDLALHRATTDKLGCKK